MSEKSLILRKTALNLIAEVAYPTESIVNARKRVRERARRAVLSGKISDTSFAGLEFSRWARDVFGLPYQDWMPPEVMASEMHSAEKIGIGDCVDATVIPGNREKLEVEYVKALEENNRLSSVNEENKLLREEKRRLEERLNNRLKKCSDSGKQGGRGNEK